MPSYVVAKLPADVGQLQEGKASIPLLPLHVVDGSLSLHTMLQGGERTGSLRYEAQMLVTYMGILDLMSSWQAEYDSLLDGVVQDADAKALLKAPLSGLRYLHGSRGGGYAGRGRGRGGSSRDEGSSGGAGAARP